MGKKSAWPPKSPSVAEGGKVGVIPGRAMTSNGGWTHSRVDAGCLRALPADCVGISAILIQVCSWDAGACLKRRVHHHDHDEQHPFGVRDGGGRGPRPRAQHLGGGVDGAASSASCDRAISADGVHASSYRAFAPSTRRLYFI